MEDLPEKELSDGRYGASAVYAVRETLRMLREKDRQILSLCFWQELPQVELTAKERFCREKAEPEVRTFVAQLTDTHCRCLATLEKKGEVRRYITFLGGDEFLPNWGFGENNCGNETRLAVKGDIKRVGATMTSAA